MANSDLRIEEYTDKSIVVLGNTRDVKEDLKRLGGKYNSNLKCGPGWIFSKNSQKSVQNYIKTGNIEDEKPTENPLLARLIALEKRVAELEKK